jgi:ABC-type multidrug transport system fused ATPase/permease subunit
LGIFDLIGILLIGLVGSIAIRGINSNTNFRNNLFPNWFGELTFQYQVAVLGIAAAFFLLAKTAFSAYFNKKIFEYLAYKSADIGTRLVNKIFSQNLKYIQKKSPQVILYNISNGVDVIVLGIVATGVSIITDILMLFIILIGIIIIDPAIALFSFSLFTLILFFIHVQLNSKAKLLGETNFVNIINHNSRILEVLNSYREFVIRNRLNYYVSSIKTIKFESAKIKSQFAFMPYISKYVFESTMILASLMLVGFQFLTKNSVEAVSSLAIFLTASLRVIPALLRIQQGMLTIKNSEGASVDTFKMIKELKDASESNIFINEEYSFKHEGFNPEIKINLNSFSHSLNEKFSLDKIDISINPGECVAIIGPSGAGKTTLVELILGILEPLDGIVSLSNLPVSQAIRKWPGAISYVPQKIYISPGTIKQNISLGYPDELLTDEIAWDLLRLVQLDEFIDHLPQGLNTHLEEDGQKISGGQRQRLGIARALFSRPQILVLDEATNALDSKTEFEISESIKTLSGKVTVLVIAHRLSTVRSMDKILYLEDGKILAFGSFNEVSSKSSSFNTFLSSVERQN